MEYKHLLEICEQLLKYSALPNDMLEKYYLIKERTLKSITINTQNGNISFGQILQLFNQCFNQMLTKRDINITSTEQQINHLLDIHNANDQRPEFTKTFQLLLQINSDRKELDATVTFLQNEIRKIKLELNMSNSRLDQVKKMHISEDKEKSKKNKNFEIDFQLQRQIDDLKEELQTKIEEHEEQLHQIQFKYEEQIKTLTKKNKDQSIDTKYIQLEKEQKQFEDFFDRFAEMSLPYLEKYEREFEKHQSKKYNDKNTSENDILLDFLFYLLQKYVPLYEDNREVRKSSAKKSTQSTPKKNDQLSQSLHFEQYKSVNNSNTNIDETYNKLKQELEESRKTLEKYELSRNKLQSNIGCYEVS